MFSVCQTFCNEIGKVAVEVLLREQYSENSNLFFTALNKKKMLYCTGRSGELKGIEATKK